MTQRALITGAAGFVGQKLRRHLEAQGWEVVGSGDQGQAGVIPCDISVRMQIDALLDQAGEVSHIFHLAAITFVPQASANPAEVMCVNLNGTIHLVQALAERQWPGRLLYIGSADSYGPPKYLPVDEEHPLSPANPYAVSKAAADHFCAYAAKAHGLDILRMRPFNHSGPGQPDQFVLSSFARQVAEIEAGHREPVLHVGNLSAARDFLHVDDVLRAYEIAARLGMPGQAYNICSGAAREVKLALDMLLEMSTASIEVRPDPARMRPVDVPSVYGTHQRLTEDTGWAPETGFDQILRDLLGLARADGPEGSVLAEKDVVTFPPPEPTMETMPVLSTA